MLAEAQVGLARLFRLEGQWRELRAGVRAIAEGLVLGLAARSPIVFLVGVQFDSDGIAVGNYGFWHGWAG